MKKKKQNRLIGNYHLIAASSTRILILSNQLALFQTLVVCKYFQLQSKLQQVERITGSQSNLVSIILYCVFVRLSFGFFYTDEK